MPLLGRVYNWSFETQKNSMARHVNFGNSGGKKGRSGRRSKAEEMGLVALFNECVSDAARRACLEQLAKDCQSEDFHERHEA